MPSDTEKTRTKNKANKAMTQEHKDALAEGRRYSKIVADYLAAREAHRPRRGRPVDEQTLVSRLQAVEDELATTDSPVRRLTLIQRRNDYTDQLEQIRSARSGSDLKELEREFVKIVRPYAERRGLTYTAFREAGVPPSVLKEAGLSRS